MPGAVPISERDERRAALGARHGRRAGRAARRRRAVPAGGVGGGRARRAARRRRARGGVLPPRAGRGARRRVDRHGRFLAASSCLDPLDPPLERLRRELGVEPPRYRGARFAVALTHDVDIPWRWTRSRRARGGGAAEGARPRGSGRGGRCTRRAGSRAFRSTSSAAPIRTGASPRSPPRSARTARARRSSSWPATAIAPTAPRPSRTTGCGRGSSRRCSSPGPRSGSTAAISPPTTSSGWRASAPLLAQLDGPLIGHRYHYLRVDPHRNLAPLAGLGFRYDTTLGFPDALGFRAGIAHPFRPWDFARDRPANLVEVPLAVMDATLAEERYEALSAADAKPRVLALLDWAAEHGGALLDPLASGAVRRAERARLGPPLLRADRGGARARRRLPVGRRARRARSGTLRAAARLA